MRTEARLIADELIEQTIHDLVRDTPGTASVTHNIAPEPPLMREVV